MWIVCITSVRHVLTVNGYGGRQTKENEKSWCFKGWETLVTNLIKTKESMSHNCFFLTQIQDYKRIVISFKRLFNIPNIGGFVIWHIIYVIAIFETFSQKHIFQYICY